MPRVSERDVSFLRTGRYEAILDEAERASIRGFLHGKANDTDLLLIDWLICGYRRAKQREVVLPHRLASLARLEEAAREYAAAMREAGPWVYDLDNAASEHRQFREMYVGAEIKRSAQWAGYVAELAATAKRQVPAGKRKPNRPLRNMIWQLQPIWEEATGKTIQRDSKRGGSREFITVVARIADPDVGNGEIDEAIRWAIASRKAGKLAVVKLRL